MSVHDCDIGESIMAVMAVMTITVLTVMTAMTAKTARTVTTSVADPGPHSICSLDPDPYSGSGSSYLNTGARSRNLL